MSRRSNVLIQVARRGRVGRITYNNSESKFLALIWSCFYPKTDFTSYRTHLSPTLRRGSGSAARAAVAAAMEAAGLKSTSTRAPRKSKGSAAGTPSSTASAPAGHLPSPYATPTSQGPSPYAPYNMYDPSPYGYPTHPLPPPGITMAQTQSAASSRVPSPVNGHSSSHSSVGSMPNHQPYFPQPFSPAYSYQSSNMNPYGRYQGNMPAPYGGPPHHSLYSPGMNSDHAPPHLYSPMNTGFQAHSRESSYGVLTPGYPPNPMSNGYPPRTQSSTPLSQSTGHDDRRYPSPPGRRRTPPDMLSQGVVDPSNMNRSMPMPSGYAGYTMHHNPYSYNGHGPNGGPGGPMGISGRDVIHRASISSLSDGSGAGGSDGSAAKGLSGENVTLMGRPDRPIALTHPV